MKNNKVVNIFYTAFGLSVLVFLLLCLCGDISNQQHVIAPSLKRLQTDFFCVLRYICERDPYNSPIYGFQEKPYFPIAYLMLYPFTLFFDYLNVSEIDCLYLTTPRIAASIFALISLFMWIHSMTLLCRKYSTNKWIIPLSLFSSCFLFSLVRGNNVLISTACIMYFLCYYDSHDKKAVLYSVLAISFASLLKVYPAFFALLWFNKKDYKKLFQVVAVCLIAGFLPFLFFKGGFDNIGYMVRNISMQGTMYQTLLRPDRVGIISLAVQLSEFLNVQSDLWVILAKISNCLLLIISVVLFFVSNSKWHKMLLAACVTAVFPISGFIFNFTLFIPIFAIILGYYYKEIPHASLIILLVLFYFSMVPIQIVYHGISLTQIINNISGITLWLFTIVFSITDGIIINKEKIKQFNTEDEN